MTPTRVSPIDTFSRALRAVAGGGSFATLEAWRRLAFRALRQAGLCEHPGDDLVGDVVQLVWVRLLDLRERSPRSWRLVLGFPEARLRGWLRRVAMSAVLDLDPQRKAVRALAQVIADVLRDPTELVAAPPTTLTDKGRFSREAVGHAVAWALERPDAPRRAPDPLARYLLLQYGLDPIGGADPDAELLATDLDPESLAERREHARRVIAAVQEILDEEEVRTLDLHLRGATVDDIAEAVGCRRTRAHGLATRARRGVALAVAELGGGPRAKPA